MKTVATWLAVAVFSIACGVMLLRYLTVHPLHMDLYLILFMLGVFGLVLILARAFHGKTLLLAILASVIGILMGYGISTKAFLAREDHRIVPELTRSTEDPGDGHTAVVYFTHGEPETYDPIGWINQFNEFDEQGIAFVPLLMRPIFTAMLRNAYLEVGRSDHRSIHQQMLQSLENAYRLEGDSTTRFYLSFLDDEPRPDAAMIAALNDGASRVVVSEVFLTISNHTAEGENQINAVGGEQYGAEVLFTGPMYDSELLKTMFVARANEIVGTHDKSKVGILLVGHGQPDEWDVEWPTETAQEIAFRESVLEYLAQDGFDPDNMSMAWMEFKEPQPAEKVEQFYRNGVDIVLYFAAAISADSIHSMYDIPELVNEADVPEDVLLVNLGAWNDDPIVIAAIKEKIDTALDDSLR